MILIMQNLGSKPNITRKTTTEVVIIIGFLFFFQIVLIAANFSRSHIYLLGNACKSSRPADERGLKPAQVFSFLSPQGVRLGTLRLLQYLFGQIYISKFSIICNVIYALFLRQVELCRTVLIVFRTGCQLPFPPTWVFVGVV